MTPTEFQQAHLAGSPLIKLFPGSSMGADYIKHLLAPLPHLKIVVTGGVQVNALSIKTWLDAGVFATGIGSQLFSKEAITTGDYKGITEKLKEILLTLNVKR